MERTITIDTPAAEARPDSEEAPEAQEDSKPMDGEELHDCRNPDSQNQAESRTRNRDEADEANLPARSRRRVTYAADRRRQRQEAEDKEPEEEIIEIHSDRTEILFAFCISEEQHHALC